MRALLPLILIACALALPARAQVPFFSAFDGASASGNELWKSDGTEAGTLIVKDIAAGPASSLLSGLTPVGGTLFLVASDGTGASGNELWKSDGTEAGTALVKDVRPGPESSVPQALAALGGTLLF